MQVCLFQHLIPPAIFLIEKIFAQIVVQKEVQHRFHTFGKAGVFHLFQRQPGYFALIGGSKLASETAGFIAKHHIPGTVFVCPVLDAAQNGGRNGQPSFFKHFADDGIGKDSPFSTWPPGKVMPL